jgi:PhzF family phenazine biosynthesis protein
VLLCGHATLASAFVLTEFLGEAAGTIRFDSASGPLWVKRNSAGLLELNFPVQAPQAANAPEQLIKGLALKGWAYECLAKEDFLVVLESAEQLRALQPDYGQLQQLDLRGVIVTSPSDQAQYDFYARFFAPKLQVPEDPVTGSAYTQLVPYWQERLGQTEFMARQLSSRGGDVYCSLAGERVLIAGNAVCYLRGEIEVD